MSSRRFVHLGLVFFTIGGAVDSGDTGSSGPHTVTSPNTRQSSTRIVLFERDNQQGRSCVVYREAGPEHQYAGDIEDLDDRRFECNDVARSATLFGPAGTTVWLYNAKSFKRREEVLEIKVPAGASSIVVNNLNRIQPGMRWEVKKGGGIQGKVSGVQWK
jgi:hypothetical protein